MSGVDWERLRADVAAVRSYLPPRRAAVPTAAEVLADLGPVLEALVPPRPEDWSGCASHATPHRHAKTRLSTAPEEKSE